MAVKDEYDQATRAPQKEWWCRPQNDAKDKPRQIPRPRQSVVKWRIGWARTLRCCAAKDVQIFLESISESWECGKITGSKHARRGEHNCEDIKSYSSYGVISFRHAAWLLGYLYGYEEHCKNIITPRGGRKNARRAAQVYNDLLIKRKWKDDQKVKKLLSIDPTR